MSLLAKVSMTKLPELSKPDQVAVEFKVDTFIARIMLTIDQFQEIQAIKNKEPSPFVLEWTILPTEEEEKVEAILQEAFSYLKILNFIKKIEFVKGPEKEGHCHQMKVVLAIKGKELQGGDFINCEDISAFVSFCLRHKIPFTQESEMKCDFEANQIEDTDIVSIWHDMFSRK